MLLLDNDKDTRKDKKTIETHDISGNNRLRKNAAIRIVTYNRLVD